MSTHTLITRQAVTRRDMLFGAALVGGLALAATANASAKMAPSMVNYRPTPKGSARCDNCTQWLVPDGCKIVSGKINPAGWCIVYARKP